MEPVIGGEDEDPLSSSFFTVPTEKFSAVPDLELRRFFVTNIGLRHPEDPGEERQCRQDDHAQRGRAEEVPPLIRLLYPGSRYSPVNTS